jgi:hypothetical protein
MPIAIIRYEQGPYGETIGEHLVDAGFASFEARDRAAALSSAHAENGYNEEQAYWWYHDEEDGRRYRLVVK